jgi:hypothetical protein
MNPDTTMTIPELIALLANSPRHVKWYVENRTVASVNFKHRNELTNINCTFGLCFNLAFLKDSEEHYYPLSLKACALLDDDFTIIIKDSNDIFYALTAEEVSQYDISNLVNG